MSCAKNWINTNRYTFGRGACGSKIAIVLRSLGWPIEQYLNWVQTNILPSYTTIEPKSVHYAVSRDGGTYQLVSDNDTAWGLDAFSGQWPGWEANCGNSQFIYVGIESPDNMTDAEYEELVKLLCCVSINNNIPADRLHIITEFDLDQNKTGITELPALLLADVESCRINNGIPELPTIGDLGDRITALEECCADITDKLADQVALTDGLPDRVNDIENRLNIVESTSGDHENRIGNLEGQIASLQNQILALMNILDNHRKCIDKLCPTPDKCAPITYTLEPRNSMLLTPNVPVHINLPNRVEDTPGTASVLPGPLWSAKLTCECNYEVSVTVGLEPSEYCDGSMVWVDVVANNEPYRVETVTPGAGNHTVALAGVIPLSVPPAVDDLYVRVGTNDVTTPYKTIRYANVNIHCV